MKGYLYNLLGEGIEELYWSEEELNVDNLKAEYRLFELDVFSNEGDFEDWWNQDDNKKIKIHRVFLEEVYI